ncbi:hypothetical protein ACH5RR_031120 [Cinchona calisaya]|uniref:Heat shock factor binding protein n=1 Tax=Cinchona calisaya TaxID=153742 RepID=A0ABD2YE97_9GENT
MEGVGGECERLNLKEGEEKEAIWKMKACSVACLILSCPLDPAGFGAGKDGHDGDTSKQSTADMTAFVQNLLQQMRTYFPFAYSVVPVICKGKYILLSIISLDCYNWSSTMLPLTMFPLDEMGNRIDELEQSINDLRAEMGQDGSPSPSAPLKLKDESKSADENA